MVLVVAFLGQELRKISKKSHTSVAALSAYLNEVNVYIWRSFSEQIMKPCIVFTICYLPCVQRYLLFLRKKIDLARNSLRESERRRVA
jgi:hypothetical protein